MRKTKERCWFCGTAVDIGSGSTHCSPLSEAAKRDFDNDRIACGEMPIYGTTSKHRKISHSMAMERILIALAIVLLLVVVAKMLTC